MQTPTLFSLCSTPWLELTMPQHCLKHPSGLILKQPETVNVLQRLLISLLVLISPLPARGGSAWPILTPWLPWLKPSKVDASQAQLAGMCLGHTFPGTSPMSRSQSPPQSPMWHLCALVLRTFAGKSVFLSPFLVYLSSCPCRSGRSSLCHSAVHVPLAKSTILPTLEATVPGVVCYKNYHL